MRILLDCSGLPESYDAASIIARAAEAYGRMLRPGEPGMNKTHARVLADGRTSPSAVIAIAESWNDGIAKKLHDAVKSFREQCPVPDGSKIDSCLTYELAKAAMAASDMFYHFGDQAVHVEPNEKYLGVTLTKSQVQFIKNHPEKFVVIDALVE